MSKLSKLVFATLLTCLLIGQTNAGADPDLRSTLEENIAYLQNEWARIKYQVPDDTSKLKEFATLEAYAGRVTARYSDRAEARIWEAIVLASDAGVKKGLSALGKVKKAKELLESALKIDETALNGSAHASLGSLYYQVPRWPLAFGDNEKAEEHLQAALRINPNGIDPNYFYGDFLLHESRYDEALAVLKHALEAPPRAGRELADAGRRMEIKADIEKAQTQLSIAAAK